MLRRRLLATSLSVLLAGFALSPTGTAPAQVGAHATANRTARRSSSTGSRSCSTPSTGRRRRPSRRSRRRTTPRLHVRSRCTTASSAPPGRVVPERAAVAQAATTCWTRTSRPTRSPSTAALTASLGAIPGRGSQDQGGQRRRGRRGGHGRPGGGPARRRRQRRVRQGDRRRACGSRATTPFVGPWLGFMDKLVVKRPIEVDGPDPITSADVRVRLPGGQDRRTPPPAPTGPTGRPRCPSSSTGTPPTDGTGMGLIELPRRRTR